MRSYIIAAAALAAAMHPACAWGVSLPRQTATERRGWVEPATGSYINARQVFLWSDGAVYRVYTQPGMITDIALQAGEALVSVAAGDTARWVIGDTTSGSGEDRRTHVLVKPFSVGLATNIVITTDKRVYHVSVSSAASGGMAALSWNYPLDEIIALKRAEAKAAAPVAEGLGIERLYFGYRITGDQPSWRPVRAFDDGRQTFIEFPTSISVDEAPPLFLIGEGGAAELVNYRMRDRFYVVDRIFSVAELRLGTSKQQVVRITRGRAKRGRP